MKRTMTEKEANKIITCPTCQKVYEAIAYDDESENEREEGMDVICRVVEAIIENAYGIIYKIEDKPFECSMSPECPCDDCQRENDCPLPPDRI